MVEKAHLRPSPNIVPSFILQDGRQRVVLKLKKPEDKRKVKWEEGTVDNEHMNKKKSKCKLI